MELSAVLEALALVLRNATRLPLLATRATAVVKKKKPKVAKEKKEMTAIMIIELTPLETVMARRYLLMRRLERPPLATLRPGRIVVAARRAKRKERRK